MELNFDPSTVEKTNDFELIPAGTYKAIIVSTEEKPTQNPQNRYLSIKWQIVDGPFRNRLIFENLNLFRPDTGLTPEQKEKNKTTVNIAKSKLAEICECAKISMLQRSEQLHTKMMCIEITITPATPKYPHDSNNVKKHTAINGGATLPGTEPAMPSNLPFGK